MAHYAILNSNNVVIHVTTGKDENNTDYEIIKRLADAGTITIAAAD